MGQIKYVFCQFHTDFLNLDVSNTLADKYYAEIWKAKAKDGYYKPDAFWEIPTWITEIDGILDKHGLNSELNIIECRRDLDLSEKYDFKNTVFLFSALDVNKHFIKDVLKINANPGLMIYVGGYISDPRTYFTGPNVIWKDSIAAFCRGQGLDYSYEVSYRLFKHEATIPRLTMSTGCLHNCKFCCVDKDLIGYNDMDIRKQISAMENLDFKLVYINDKTFGQHENYQNLALYKILILKYNPKFEGFIIQTTAAKCKDRSFCINLRALGVRIVEIGVESYNDRLLRDYCKPHNEKMILKSFTNLKSTGLKIIPNIIIGLIGESASTYQNTMRFLEFCGSSIYSLNIYNLAIYDNTDLAKEVNHFDSDANELESNKSYHSTHDKKAIDYFYNGVFGLGLNILKG